MRRVFADEPAAEWSLLQGIHRQLGPFAELVTEPFVSPIAKLLTARYDSITKAMTNRPWERRLSSRRGKAEAEVEAAFLPLIQK
ncbi:MAG TPA: hypothetical protein VGM54_03955 [Chthoniobacter sp.]|jgi:hypothetical protein